MDSNLGSLARAAATTLCALAALPVANGSAWAESAGGGHGSTHPAVVNKPRVDLRQPAEASDFTQEVTQEWNAAYDDYLALKNQIQNDTNIQFSMPVSVSGQWGTPDGGPGTAMIVYSPAVTWTPFTNTAIGSGAFDFAFQSNQFWTGATRGHSVTCYSTLTISLSCDVRRGSRRVFLRR